MHFFSNFLRMRRKRVFPITISTLRFSIRTIWNEKIFGFFLKIFLAAGFSLFYSSFLVKVWLLSIPIGGDALRWPRSVLFEILGVELGRWHGPANGLPLVVPPSSEEIRVASDSEKRKTRGPATEGARGSCSRQQANANAMNATLVRSTHTGVNSIKPFLKK